MKSVLRAIGFGIVLTILAAAGYFVAHDRGWLAFGGHEAGEQAGLFCREHGVPEKFCTLCHNELKDRLAMCAKHGLPEVICTVCHPQVEQKFGLKMICLEHRLPRHLCVQCNPRLAGGEVASDWCVEHGVPESLCTRCDPKLAERIAMCRDHEVPADLCTICRPELAKNFTLCKPHQLPAAFCASPGCQAAAKLRGDDEPCCENCKGDCPRAMRDKYEGARAAKSTLPTVRLGSRDVEEVAGIEHTPIGSVRTVPSVTANGEVGYDESRLAQVRPRIAGIIREVAVRPGDTVQAGSVIAVIDAGDLGAAKADYLAAAPLVEQWTKTLARLRGLIEQGLSIGEKSMLEAETELRRAKAELIKASQRLRNLGLGSDRIAALDDEPEETRNQLRLVAPLSGTVVRRRAVVGDAVEATSELFTVSDLSHMWVQLDVYERDLRRIHVGQPMTFRVPGLAPAEFHGSITWIDTEVNDRSRTIRVRAEVENTSGLLRANMFGKGEIHIGEASSSLAVPRDALQWNGSSYIVFVRKAADEFEPRRVLIGEAVGGLVRLAWADLKSGERVVTTGSFLLKTETMKNGIGAGCCQE